MKKIKPQHRYFVGRGTTTAVVYHIIASNSSANKNIHEIIIAHLLLLISQFGQIHVAVFIQPLHFFRDDGQGRIYRRRCYLTNHSKEINYLSDKRLTNAVLQSIMAKC